MKTIDNYINERLNPRHLGKVSEFPIDGTLEERIKFLENKGFTDIGKPSLSPGARVERFNFFKGRVFEYKEDILRFADTSRNTISKNNPIYVIANSIFSFNKKYYKEYETVDGDKELTKEEFLKEINKRFKF
jgi:hypothetical protein